MPWWGWLLTGWFGLGICVALLWALLKSYERKVFGTSR